MEKDLSLKQQFLDVVILRKRKGRFREQLPDGLDNLRAQSGSDPSCRSGKRKNQRGSP